MHSRALMHRDSILGGAAMANVANSEVRDMSASSIRHGLASAAVFLSVSAVCIALHAQPDFGDNTSRWAYDGECDDPRFEGEGAADTLLEEDRGHDAADCRKLFEAGRIAFSDALGSARRGASTPLTARIERNGRLELGDETLGSGEFVDSYEFEGAPGQHVTIDLRSSAFDTYLILKDPAGEQTENDDADDGDVGHSRLDTDLSEAGSYRVLVTSYETGERGPYTLTIDPSAGSPRAPQATRDARPLTVGTPIRGELEDGDPVFRTGEHHDTYVFDGDEGDTLRLELTSVEFDTYLGLVTPSGEEIANDDDDGATDRSAIELTLPETGRYRVQATSYAAAETGAYRLALTSSTASVPAARRSRGRVYGLFAGIGDYLPPNTDLQFTAEDAVRIRDALIDGGGMRAEDAYTLVDSDATVANVSSAIREIGRRMSSDDTFVMFYSGHGGQAPRSDGPTASDPDGMDETLVLYDGPMLDDELRQLFDGIRQGTVLLWLDSCFSGGFAKDIVSAPGRMGIFSSEEDITSNVASKFRAGGYLSLFLDEAIAQGLADDDEDDSITAIELSQYLHERYRADVKSTRAVDVVRTEMTLGYQHLVVDRGSIGAYDVLFER